jgi:hypothetical protein
MEILSIIGSCILIVFLQLLVPGFVVLGRVIKSTRWSLADSFFCGWLLNVFAGFLLLPFFNDTLRLSLAVRVFIVLVCLYGIFSIGPMRDVVWFWNDISKRVIKKSFAIHPFFIISLVAFLCVLLVGGHNLGYDDVAHLVYLDKVLSGHPFPVYIAFAENWEAARYPSFGLLVGIMGAGITGSALCLYYLLPLFLLLVFVAKIFSFVVLKSNNVLQGYGSVAVVISILVYLGHDNYLNFAVYPLQVAKLLLMSGIIYLLLVWREEKSLVWFVIGAGLLNLSLLHHLNIILPLAVIFLVIFLYVVLIKKRLFKIAVHSILLFGLIIIAVPASFVAENSIIRYIPPPLEEPKKDKSVKIEKEKISVLDKIIFQGKRALNWVREGGYKQDRIIRVFSADLLLVPLAVLIFSYFQIAWIFLSIIVAFSALIISVEMARTVPKQYLTTLFRGSTLTFIYDFQRSNLSLEDDSRLETDGYTALYLTLLGRKNVHEMNELNQTILFYPFFPFPEAKKLATGLENSKALLNGRLWGPTAVSRWHSQSENSLTHLADHLEKLEQNFTLQNVSSVFSGFIKFFVDQLNTPFVVIDLRTLKADQEQLFDLIPSGEPMIWRDRAVVPLYDLPRGTRVEIVSDKEEGNFRMKGVISDPPDSLVVEPDDENKNTFIITARDDCDRALLLMQHHLGHLSGLGTLTSLKVIRHENKLDVNDG